MYKDIGKKFDIRIVEKNFRDGIITSPEYEDYLRNLPDASSNIEEEHRFSFHGEDNQRENES